MEIMRLVVTAPVGGGKSTFIRSVSEIEVVDTDRRATDETALLKAKGRGQKVYDEYEFSRSICKGTGIGLAISYSIVVGKTWWKVVLLV